MANLDKLEFKIKENKEKITSKFVDFWLQRDSFDNTIKTLEAELLVFTKDNYDYQLELFNSPTDSDTEEIFFWKNNTIKIWCIGIGKKTIGESDILFFATRSSKNEIKIIDAVESTSTGEFYRYNTLSKISYLITSKIIPDITEYLISSSVNNYPSPDRWAIEWANNELSSIDSLTKSPSELFEFNKSIIRAKRYNFENMLLSINNTQFSMEFDECIFAYNNQKWFICAAGLGSILEHLLYLILEKNNLIDNTFPDDPTAKIYLEYLSRQPIKISKRDKTYIRTLFLTRNSISHFNQGFTSKDQCNHLMSGIKEVFHNFYIKDFTVENN